MTFSLACALAFVLQTSPCASQPEALQLGQGTVGIDGVPSLVFEGAPLPGHPMALRAESLAPDMAGLLLVGNDSTPTALPAYGATLFPSLPFVSIPFASDSSGATPVLAEIGSVSLALCGTELVVQALVLDPSAQGGVAFTRALRLVVGQKKPKAPFDNYSVPLGVGPEELVAADVNLDGTFDLVTASQEGVMLAIGSGNGQFRPGLAIHDQSASAVVVGLVDADAYPDIVATRDGGTQLRVFLGDGSGSFDSVTGLPTVEDAIAIDLGDFDDDGRTDAAVASDGHGLAVHFGEPGGTFGPPQVVSPALRLSDVVVADFDGDGTDDVAACDRVDDALLVRLGSPTGVLATVPDSATGSCPDQIAAGDWDGDGDVDLMSVDCSIGGIPKLEGNGDGTFAVAGAPLFPTKAVGCMAASDLDGDGVLDVVYADLSTDLDEQSRVYSNLGGGDGTFTEVGAVAIGPFPQSVVVADLDEDSTLDVITYVHQGAMVSYGEGGGLLAGPSEWETPVRPSGLAAGDFDGDGRDDLAVCDQVGVTIHLGQEAGFAVPAPISLALSVDEVVAAHVDSDAVLDLVVTASFHDTVLLLPGLGDGTFAGPITVPAGDGPEDVVVGDLDGDSHADIATLNSDSDDVRIAFGDGSGGFVAGPSLPVELADMGLDVGDVDADGNLDIVAAVATGAIRVYLGTGGGGFAHAADLPVPLDPSDARWSTSTPTGSWTSSVRPTVT